MKRLSVLIVVAVLGLLPTVLCLLSNGCYLNNGAQNSAFLLKRYSSLADLRRDSTLVARGSIVVVVGFDKSRNVTQFAFRITRVIVGNLTGSTAVIRIYHSPPYIILLQHNGGLLYDPPMQVGDELILFMHESARVDMPDGYVVVGGPQGRFIVKSARIYSVGDLYPEARNTTLSIQGMDESSFIAAVQEASR
jgi:hypothetical protein